MGRARSAEVENMAKGVWLIKRDVHLSLRNLREPKLENLKDQWKTARPRKMTRRRMSQWIQYCQDAKQKALVSQSRDAVHGSGGPGSGTYPRQEEESRGRGLTSKTKGMCLEILPFVVLRHVQHYRNWGLAHDKKATDFRDHARKPIKSVTSIPGPSPVQGMRGRIVSWARTLFCWPDRLVGRSVDVLGNESPG